MFEKRYTLLLSQKKKVYDTLREIGLEPAEFSWSKVEIVDRFIVSRLNHRRGQYYFQFSSYELNSWCVACPGLYRTMDYQYPRTWEEQDVIFRQWAEGLKRELDTPDPWAELAKYRLVLNAEFSQEAVNEPIPAVEAEQIGQALRRLADDIAREFILDTGQASLVGARLGYLADAARRERSRDWIYTTMGVWSSLAVALGLTQEQAARLWQMLKCDLGSFVNLLLDRAVTPPVPHKREILEIKPISRSSEADKSSVEAAG